MINSFNSLRTVKHSQNWPYLTLTFLDLRGIIIAESQGKSKSKNKTKLKNNCFSNGQSDWKQKGTVIKMLLSDNIARLIEEMLDAGDGSADLKRNDLASRLGCVPSQISYVISSRFTPERGYITESRRGGGGYIRIVRVKMDKNKYLMHFFHAIGVSVSEADAKAYLTNLHDSGIITTGEQRIIDAAVNGSALDKVPPAERNAVRADIMRHVIMALIG